MMTAIRANATSVSLAASRRRRVFIGSNTPYGILAFDRDPVSAELMHAGVAAKINNVDWITLSAGLEYLYAASEVDLFNGKPTGEVASFSVNVTDGKLQSLSAQNSASVSTCHVAVDQTGRVLLSADYGGGSAASFLISAGQLSPAAWTERYTAHGPNADRQGALTPTSLRSRPTTASPTSTIWAATASTSTA